MTKAKPTVRVKAGSTAMADGLVNVVSGVGTTADKSRHGFYGLSMVTADQSEFAYRFGSGVFRKIIDIPPYEMTREGREWMADDDAIAKLEAEEARLGLWTKLREVETSARLHGLAYLVLGLPGNSDTAPPRNPPTRTLRYVMVLGKSQLQAEDLNTDLNSPGYGEPVRYRMQGAGSVAYIHPDRVIPVIRQPRPAGSVYATGVGDFGGDPMLATIETSLKNVDASQANVAALIHELKVDTIGINGLTQMLETPDGEQRLMRRLQVGQTAASILNSRLLDTGPDGKSGETWETRQLSLSGIPEVLREFKSFLAGVVDIPYTRLWGETPGGLNSTGKGEQVDFNRSIKARQATDLKPVIDRVDRWLVPSVLGSRPDGLHWKFAPLSDTDPETEAKIEETDAKTLKLYADMGVVPDTVIAAMAKGRVIESAYWPGAEAAFDEADDMAEIEPIEEPEEADSEGRPALLAANDALPRPLYVSRRLLNIAEFTKWAKAQGFSSVPDELHVTILYSKAPVDWMAMGEAWEGDRGEITIAPGGARLVEPLGDKGAIVLLFNSSNLSWRHNEMIRNGASSDYPDYQAHVTITYDGSGVDLSAVEPYRGKLVFGPEIFEEIVADWRPNES